CSAQNLVNEVVEDREVWSIGHETSDFDPLPVRVHGGQSLGEREATDPNLIGTGEGLTNNIEALRTAVEYLESRRDIRSLPKCAGRYPSIAAAVAALSCRSCLIDGEVVICGEDGIPVFDRLIGSGLQRTSML